jgi:hypothetical protein
MAQAIMAHAAGIGIMAKPYDDTPKGNRARQFDAIEGKLGTLQKRYPMMDLAYEFRIWVLATKSRDDFRIIDYEKDFLMRMEQLKRKIEAGGRTMSVEQAFSEMPDLAPGFSRLTAAFRLEPFISVDTARVYCEEFGDMTGEAFMELCSEAIRRLEKFPTVAALLKIRDERSRDRSESTIVDQIRTENESILRERERVNEIDRAISGLPEAELAEIDLAVSKWMATQQGMYANNRTMMNIRRRYEYQLRHGGAV